MPDKFIHAPWGMSAAEQQRMDCGIGLDFPVPIVYRAVQRGLALTLFKQASQPALK